VVAAVPAATGVGRDADAHPMIKKFGAIGISIYPAIPW
jgi:hypothetical protein